MGRSESLGRHARRGGARLLLATGIPTLSTSIEITAVALLLTTGLYALHRRAK
jgi:hypothetical protein